MMRYHFAEQFSAHGTFLYSGIGIIIALALAWWVYMYIQGQPPRVRRNIDQDGGGKPLSSTASNQQSRGKSSGSREDARWDAEDSLKTIITDRGFPDSIEDRKLIINDLVEELIEDHPKSIIESAARGAVLKAVAEHWAVHYMKTGKEFPEPQEISRALHEALPGCSKREHVSVINHLVSVFVDGRGKCEFV